VSNQQTPNALLPGYKGPAYPEVIKQMNLRLNARLHNGHSLEATGRRVKGYAGRISATTSDGYAWFWGLRFKVGEKGIVMVLFPWTQDFQYTDGTQLDRSIAVYTKNITEDQVEKVLKELLRYL
jgi:hypothetical protein